MHLLSRLSRIAQPVAPAEPPATAGRAARGAAQGAAPASARSADPYLPANWLRSILAAGDAQPDRTRRGAEGHIHVSGLIGFCAREHVILRLHSDQPVLNNVDAGMRIVWALGRAAEHHVRDSVISIRRNDVMGVWRCPCGETKHTGYRPSVNCRRCQKSVHVYGEMTLFDEEAGVSGNPDVLIREGQFIVPVEIKSMNKKEWDTLAAPKGDHVFQVMGYAAILRRLRYPVHRNAIIVYVSKDYMFGSPYKEFQIDTESRSLNAQWERSRQEAIAAHAATASGVIPARTMCQTVDSTRAKTCKCTLQCFSRD